MHLRDRGGGDRRAEGGEEVAHRLAERELDRALGLGLRERRHLVLQASRGRARTRRRPRPAASPGTGRASHRSDRAGSARRPAGWRRPCWPAARSAAPARARRAPGSGSGVGSTRASTPSRANTKPARARRDEMGERGDHLDRPVGRENAECDGSTVCSLPLRGRDGEGGACPLSQSGHNRQPECSATMPPVMRWNETRRKPAARIISANASGRGKRRIDSTR